MESFIPAALGWAGTVGTFVAYVMIWRGWAETTAMHYSMLNAVGGFMAAAGAASYSAWPAFSSSLVWGIIGALGVATAMRARVARRRARVQELAQVHTQALAQVYAQEPTEEPTREQLQAATATAVLPEVPAADSVLVEAAAEPVDIAVEVPENSLVTDLVPGGWDPNRTEASPIVLPWLERRPTAHTVPIAC